MRRRLAIVFLALTAASAASAQESGRDLRRGESLLTHHCGKCHSIGRRGASPNPQAPAFRTLGRRYAIESLEEALGEGLLVGHPDMPEFRFAGRDVGAIIAYLRAIQEQ